MQGRIRSVVLWIAAVIITVLHARALWQRIADLSITEPNVIARWCAAAIVAVAALLLLHLRVSRRSWVVFWVVVLLLHTAMPIENARLDVLIEAIFAVVPLMLVAAASSRTPRSRIASLLDQENFALRITLWTASLPSRAPPSR
jgi:hypothetical protein